MNNHHTYDFRKYVNKRLYVSICMLLIASIMVVTSTYAWIVLSTAPEVREITTTVGANGALEIKLNIPEDPGDRNSLFRNIVDFRNVSYGLDQVALLPSIAVSGDSFADEMLLIPEYGDDGLATGSGNSNKVLIGSLSDEDNAFHQSEATGVRVVGSATGVTARQGIYNSAMSAARSAMSSAKSNAISSLKNDAFMGIVIKMMSNDGADYSADDVAALETIVAKLETSVSKMEEAYKQIIIAAAASDNGQDDIVASLVKDTWGSEGLTLENIAATGAISVGEYSVSVDSDILAGIRALQATAANVAEARDLYDNLGGDYSTANVNPIITKLVNRSYVTVNGSDPADVDFADVVLNGAVITMNPGAGVYVEIADQVGNYNANISNNISMVTASSRSSGYIASAIADVADVGAPGVDSSELPMTAFYGYILDLVFRTNAENSHLLLQTEAIDRIDNENSTEGTMGGGSYMKFTATEGTGITNEQVIKIMSCFRVVFFDTTSKAVLGRAQLDADGAVINSDESVSAKLYMDGSTEITSLTRNEEHKISVLVYLDAEMLENQHVAATTATSITGVMNIQFASDAELIPAYSNQNTNPNVPDIPEDEYEGLEFTLNDDGVSYSVTGIGTYKDTNLIIPSTYKGLPVTNIGEEAFEGCTWLTSIEIPDSVISIGYDAFCGCNSLTSIVIGNSVTSIGDGAFFNCAQLKDVYYTGDVEGWLGITFNGPSIHSNPMSWGLNLYFKNELVTEVVIPDSVTRIGRLAFYNYSLLTSIVIPNSVTSIGERAFKQCSSLTSIEIPDSVRSIGDNAFAGCDSLISIEIPDSVRSIRDYAFAWCDSLTSINFGGTVEQWNAITKATDWDYDTGSYTVYCTNGEIAKDGTITYLETASKGLEFTLNANGTSYSATGIGTCADTDLVIPSTYNDLPVTSIGKDAFDSCTNITSVVISSGIKRIGDYAFDNCENLMNITIGDGVTSIGRGAFRSCDKLKVMTIPASVTFMDSDIFFDCGNIESVFITDLKAWCTMYRGTLYSVPAGADLYLNDKLLVDVVIPDGITSIGYEFAGCDSIKSIVLPDSIIRIEDYAFYGCQGLEYITLPDSVKYIGDTAFSGCDSLTSITIPESVTFIDVYAFSDCDSLTHIVIPDSVSSIEENTFMWCDSLTTIIIPNSVKSIGQEAFEGCKMLANIQFEGTVAQWNAIGFGDRWNNNVPATEVVCSDGTVSLI